MVLIRVGAGRVLLQRVRLRYHFELLGCCQEVVSERLVSLGCRAYWVEGRRRKKRSRAAVTQRSLHDHKRRSEGSFRRGDRIRLTSVRCDLRGEIGRQLMAFR